MPILVGGTGLYFKALIEGLAPVPDIPPEFARIGASEAERLGAEGLLASLRRAIPGWRQGFARAIRSASLRALEVIDATGTSLAEWQGADAAPCSHPEGLPKLVIAPEREPLYAAIDARFDRMIEQGALEEVRALLALGLDPAFRRCGRMACASLPPISPATAASKRPSQSPRPRPAATPSGR